MFVEMVCPPLTPPLNGVLLGTDLSHGSFVSVSCLPGFMFADRNLTEELECISSGYPKPVATWSADVRDCQRMTYTYVIDRKNILIYIIKADMFVCVTIYVPYSRPNGWAYRDET